MSRILMSRILMMGALTLGIFAANQPSAPAAPLPAVGSSIFKAVARYFGKEGTQEATEYMVKQGGKEVIERVTSTAARAGGDEAVQQVAKLVGKHGPEALTALDGCPALMPVLRALDDLPASQVDDALTRLAAGSTGRELAEAVGRYGGVVLRSELKHPGVGMVLVRTLGDEGAELATKLSTDQAIMIGRHADDIAKLPLAQRRGVMGMLRKDTDRMLSFVGRFVEDNPGKSLFTVAATTVILAEPERILGGDDVVLDAEGNPVVVSKSGLVGRSLDAGGEVAAHVSENYLQPVFYALATFAGVFGTIWLLIKMWQIRMVRKLRGKTLIR